jgi:hypothetical protein
MFKAKVNQVEALADAAAATFPRRLLAFLRREVPGACGVRAEEQVTEAIHRAHRWGLTAELDVATYAVLAFTHSPAFDKQRWAHETLDRPSVPPSQRIHEVYEAAVRRLIVEGTALAEKELK